MNRTVSYVVSVLFASLVGQSPARPLDVQLVLGQYDQARYGDFVAALETSLDLEGRLFPSFEKQADRWIEGASPGAKDRRRIVAATVALEIAHRLSERPPEHAGRFLVWASLLMRHESTLPRETERAWHFVALAGMEELYFPWVLAAGHASGNATLDLLRQQIGRGGQLAVSLRRFPNEPRFLLAQVETLESDALWRNGVIWTTLVPAVLEVARRDVAAPMPVDPRTTAERFAVARIQAAREMLAAVASVPQIQAAFESLRRFPELNEEIELHLGYLDGVAMQWPSALAHLSRLKATSTEPYLAYLAEYLTGRVLQVTDDRVGAAAAFERACAIVPGARSASAQWAAELLMSERAGDADQAYALLRSAYSDRGLADPWEQFGHGDARLWPTYVTRLREALK